MPSERREKIETKVKVRKNYVPVNKKLDIKDWVTYYFDRYNRLSNMLQNRQELRGTMSISRIQKTDGRQQVALIGMVRDITERKEAEARIHKSEERLRSIVDTAVDGIIVVSSEGLVVEFSPAAERIFGYD